VPELPDVAGFKKYLDAAALHQRIDSTRCFDERFVKEVSRRSLQRRLKGAELTGSDQWGKWLFVGTDAPRTLVLHFGMSGTLDYGSDEGDPPAHTRFVLYFNNGRRLAVISQRMIGMVSLTEDPRRWADEHDLGPDALAVDAEEFEGRLKGRRGSVKSALMNQSILAGIGNVYSDEICFQARLHPASRVKDLRARALRDLHRTMRRVLRVASRKGGNGRKAPRSWLLGKRGAGAACPRCGQCLDSTTVGGRTAWFCPACQQGP
jgi:formamidopyrimidine-DNA glycosylase